MTLLTSPKEQSFWMAFQGLIYGGGCILGPIIGGLFSDSSATWRWVSTIRSDSGPLCLQTAHKV